MFCPVCKAEYREGITHCPECDDDLVSSLPDKTRESDALRDDPAQAAVVVWQGSDLLLADRILQVLEEAGVEVHSDRLLTLEMPVPFGRDSCGIWVHRNDELRARDLIRDYLESVEDRESDESAPSREDEEAS